MAEKTISDYVNEIVELKLELSRIKDKEEHATKEAIKERKKRQEFESNLTEVTSERDKLKSDLENYPDKSKAKVAELQQKIRDRDHLDRFKAIAKDLKVKDGKALDDVWKNSGYKAETDDVDDELIKSSIASYLDGREYLLDPGNPAGTGQTNAAESKQSVQTPPSPVKGRATNAGSPYFAYTAAELANPIWMSQNQGKLAKAMQEGTAKLLGE